MDRNVNIESIDFPVELRPVFIKNRRYSEMKNFNAVIGKFNKEEKIFSVVSKGYSLISNTEALDLGKRIFRKYFPSTNEESFEIFNINYPETRSFCNIDIINKVYRFNLWEKEVYVPFLRIINSYNRTKTLKYEIGFSRKLCDNGVIFEKKTIKLKYIHYKRSVEEILKSIETGNETQKLKRLEAEFTEFMKSLKELKIAKEYFTPVTAKIYQLKFNVNSDNEKQRMNEIKRMNEFRNYCHELTGKYTKELGENAYSVFNVATEFANNRDFVKSYRYNDYQTKAGEWLKTFAKKDKEVSIEDYINEYKYLLN